MKFQIIIFIISFISALSADAATLRDTAYCDSLINSGKTVINEHGNYADGFRILQNALDLAEQGNMYRQQFLAQNNIGILFYLTLDYGEALNRYLEAYTLAIKYLTDKETMSVLNNIAILYSKDTNYPKAYDYFLQSLQIARKTDDGKRIGMYSINLGVVCNKMGDTKKAREYLRQAERYILNDTVLTLKHRTALLQSDFLEGNYRKVVEDGKKILLNDPAKQDPEVANLAAFLLADAYFHLMDYQSAAYYANLSLNHDDDLGSRIQTYELLSKIHFADKEYRKALSCKDSVILMQDSLHRVKNGHLLENSKIRFELQEAQYNLSLKEFQLSSQKRIFIGAVILALTILLLLVWILRSRVIKRRQEKKIELEKRRIIELELEHQKKEKLLFENRLRENETKMQLEQEKLKNEIEARNRQLAAKALAAAGNNQLLEELIVALSESPAHNSSTLKQLQKFKERLDSGNDWNEFISHFDQVNHGMLTTLQQTYPDLNSSDVRFISYLYMNLNTKEISSIMNITPDACRKRKERVRQKIGLEADSDLYTFLCSFSMQYQKQQYE